MIAALGLLLAMLWASQNRFIYHCGSTVQHLAPGAFGLPVPEISRQGLVQCFHNAAGSRTKVFYFHGNGARVENDYWRIGQLYAQCNCTVIAVESLDCIDKSAALFGHGERTLVLEDVAAIALNVQSGDANFLLGASLGTAHVLAAYHHLPSRTQNLISGIILENPFTSVADMIHPWVKPLLLRQWNSRAWITHVHEDVPLLLLTSEKDEIVPSHMSRTLYDASFSRDKKQVVLSGALHGHAASHPAYLPAVLDFIANHASGAAVHGGGGGTPS